MAELLCGGKYQISSEQSEHIVFYCLLDEVNAVVADLGQAYSKFGAAGQDSPRHIFPTV